MYIDRIRINWDKVSPDSYLTRIPAIGLLQELAFRRPVTFFVGENGTGKSTLLEAIAIAYGFNPEGGTLNYNFSTHDDYSELCDAITIAQGAVKGPRGGFFLRAESFLSFIRTFTRTGLFIMDEPEAALSPQRQLSLFARIAEMAREGSQYIIVTHSPILLAMPGADIIGFDNQGIRYLEYEETESYRITEMMINHRDLMVSQLLQDGD